MEVRSHWALHWEIWSQWGRRQRLTDLEFCPGPDSPHTRFGYNIREWLWPSTRPIKCLTIITSLLSIVWMWKCLRTSTRSISCLTVIALFALYRQSHNSCGPRRGPSSTRVVIQLSTICLSTDPEQSCHPQLVWTSTRSCVLCIWLSDQRCHVAHFPFS